MSFAQPSKCSPHRTYLYTVDIPGIGDVLKTDCCIRHARQWAKRAFPKLACTVSRHKEVKRESLPTGSILRQFGMR